MLTLLVLAVAGAAIAKLRRWEALALASVTTVLIRMSQIVWSGDLRLSAILVLIADLSALQGGFLVAAAALSDDDDGPPSEEHQSPLKPRSDADQCD